MVEFMVIVEDPETGDPAQGGISIDVGLNSEYNSEDDDRGAFSVDTSVIQYGNPI